MDTAGMVKGQHSAKNIFPWLNLHSFWVKVPKFTLFEGLKIPWSNFYLQIFTYGLKNVSFSLLMKMS